MITPACTHLPTHTQAHLSHTHTHIHACKHMHPHSLHSHTHPLLIHISLSTHTHTHTIPTHIHHAASQFSQQDSQKGAAANSTPSSSSKNRVSIHSKETYKPPANPYLEDEIANGEDEELPPPSPTAAWLGDAMLIDCFGEPVGREKLDSAKIIGVRSIIARVLK